MKYIYILDYNVGTCDIFKISDEIEPINWLIREGYNLDNIEWMETNEFHLNVII